jgi:hypothetical protein
MSNQCRLGYREGFCLSVGGSGILEMTMSHVNRESLPAFYLYALVVAWLVSGFTRLATQYITGLDRYPMSNARLEIQIFKR